MPCTSKYLVAQIPMGAALFRVKIDVPEKLQSLDQVGNVLDWNKSCPMFVAKKQNDNIIVRFSALEHITAIELYRVYSMNGWDYPATIAIRQDSAQHPASLHLVFYAKDDSLVLVAQSCLAPRHIHPKSTIGRALCL